MYSGIDANLNLTTHASSIKAAGYSWVGRYIKPAEPSETLTVAEAKALHAAGLNIALIVEDGFPTTDSYFTAARGTQMASAIYSAAHDVLGAPANTALFLTVDYDCTMTAIDGAITAYIKAWRAELAVLAAKHAGHGYLTGVYGSGAVCQTLKAAGLAHYAWLSESSGYLDSRTYAAGSGWDIHQTSTGTELGLSVDFDTARAFGGDVDGGINRPHLLAPPPLWGTSPMSGRVASV